MQRISAQESGGVGADPDLLQGTEGAQELHAIAIVLVGALMGLAPIAAARAHGFGSTAPDAEVATDPKAPDTSKYALLPQSLSKDAQAPARAVLDEMKVWGAGVTLAVCFAEPATVTARKRIEDAAKEWEKWSSLRFDFGDPDDPRMCDPKQSYDITIGFKGDGAYSYTGIDSKGKMPSMNLQYLDDEKTRVWQNEREFRRIVLHEFGHAIGLEHEHQSPAAHCADEIDWPAAEKFYKDRLGWSPETVHENLDTMAVPIRAAKDALQISGYDRQSIMQYALPPEIFKQGRASPCFSTTNYDLSATDKKWVAGLYPDQPDEQAHVKRAMLDTEDKVLKQGGVPDDERQAAIAKIGETFGVTLTQTNNAGRDVNANTAGRDVIAPIQNITGKGNITSGVNNGSITINNAPPR